MNTKQIQEKLQEIFREVFDDDTLTINEYTTANDIDDWDSFAQIGLVMEIEKQFQIKFQLNEVSLLENVGDMISLICQKLA